MIIYFKTAKSQIELGTEISTKAQEVIQEIINDLNSAKKKPDKQKEIEMIREVCQKERGKFI